MSWPCPIARRQPSRVVPRLRHALPSPERSSHACMPPSSECTHGSRADSKRPRGRRADSKRPRGRRADSKSDKASHRVYLLRARPGRFRVQLGRVRAWAAWRVWAGPLHGGCGCMGQRAARRSPFVLKQNAGLSPVTSVPRRASVRCICRRCPAAPPQGAARIVLTCPA
jgi:hypothetical protein